MHFLPKTYLLIDPFADPRKRATVQSVSQEDVESSRREDDSPQATFQNSLQKFPAPNSPRHRATPMSPSPSQDHHHRPISPTHRHASPTRHQVNGTANPPLLMAPPKTLLGEIQFRWYQVRSAMHRPTSPLFRFFLFVVKLTILARVCWPNNFDLTVGGGLILAAAVDLSWTFDLHMSLLLFILHSVPIWYFRQHGELCHSGHEGWDWSPEQAQTF